ncbi:ATP-binding cassette domain-containing protein [Tessaracoccus caeni]|uniref:ATP-binding cassette domain-containing protein n=1 Tax=Tessaracoccus caeni TaxID=3031239 RepID=UPI0023DC2305|nr:ATP-binding cassette domain-containing protein [Tessaracoccus caeni]MDF1486821.1 ATP-binding cassette domain-containing protein [Tessaracoccus caeni]
MILSSGVRHSYKQVLALGDISLSLESDRVALLGPNGAGKSTFLKLITTILPLQSGHLEVDGISLNDARGRSAARGRFGYVPQRMDLPGAYTVEEFLAYAGWMHRCSDLEPAVTRALEMVDLADRRSSRIKTLSGGMRQRVCIAQALVHAPSVVVVDEPTVGLDPQQRSRLRTYLAELDCQLLLATHMVDDVAGLAEEVVVLDHGRVAFHGPIAELCDGGPVTAESVERGYLRYVDPSEDA